MTRFGRPLTSLAIVALASLLWTCHGESGTNPPGPATSLTFTTSPAGVTAGVQIATVTVTALDASGHTATSFASAITLSIAAGTPGATLSGTTTANASSGVASFTSLSIDKSGSGFTLQAAASGLTSAASQTFSVAAGPATQLAFSTQPSGTKAGVAIAPAVKATAQDALGNTVTGFTGTVTVAITPGTGTAGATLSGTAAVAATAGVATFSNLSIDKAGAASLGTGYTLSATAPSLASATSDPFDITSGTAKQLQFTSQPTATAAGEGFAPLVEVSAFDSIGNLVTTFTGNVTLAIGTNPGGSTLAGTKVVAAANGVATFPGVYLDKVGSGYTLSASASGLTGATSGAFDVTAGTAARLVFTTQPVTTTDAAPIAPAVRVTARDAFGNLADGFAGNVTMTIAQNPSAGVLGGTTTLAASLGVASFADLTIDNVGAAYRLAASASGVVSDTSAAFDIVASTAAKLVCTVQPTNTAAGSAITPAIQVSARDASNQLVTSFTGNVTIAIGTNPGGGALSGTSTVAAAAGVASFPNLSIDKSGTGYTLTATASGLQSANCGPFNITSGTASQLAFTVQPSNVAAGSAIMPQVEVTAHDALGNVATGFTGMVTIAIANNPSGGTLTGTLSVAAVAGVASFSNLHINNAGLAYTLSASATGPTGATSAAFDVTAGISSHLVFSAQPTTTTAGAAIAPAVTVTAKDGSGNTDPSFTGNVTLTITSGSGTAGATLSGTKTVAAVAGVATFSDLAIDKIGTGYTLSATATGLSGTTSTAFTISAGIAARLAFTTQPASAGAGASLGTIQVTAQDAQGNLVQSYSGSVSVVIGNNPGGGALSGVTTVSAVAGVATFSGLSINKAGVGYTLSASSGALTGATSTPFTVSSGAAATLSFTVQPSNATAGAAIAPAILVSAHDDFGNAVASFGGTVTMTIATNPS